MIKKIGANKSPLKTSHDLKTSSDNFDNVAKNEAIKSDCSIKAILMFHLQNL